MPPDCQQKYQKRTRVRGLLHHFSSTVMWTCVAEHHVRRGCGCHAFAVADTYCTWRSYVTASVYQMLRGAEILFSAIFAVAFLKRSLNKFHYGGIAGCLVGICMVGASSLLSPSGGGSSDTGMVLLGMGLIVVAQVRLLLFQSAMLSFSAVSSATHARSCMDFHSPQPFLRIVEG